MSNSYIHKVKNTKSTTIEADADLGLVISQTNAAGVTTSKSIDTSTVFGGGTSGDPSAINNSTIVGKNKQLSTITVKTADAYAGRVMQNIQRWRAWAGDDINLIIGEIGFPTNRTGQEAIDWTNLAEVVYSSLTAYNIGHYTWATGHAWSTGYALKPYKLNSGVWSDTYLSPVLEKYAGNDMVGINWASLEFGAGVGGPSLADLAYHKNKGWNKIRLPINLSFFTDFNSGVFSASGGAARYQVIVDTLNKCQKLGINVMLDVHMYATWGGTVAAPVTPLNATNRAGWYKAYDLLFNTASPDANGNVCKLKDHPALFMFDLMNEPAAISDTAWQVESQLLVEYLRNTIGYDRWITVGLPTYSSMINLPSTNTPSPWIIDPLAKIYYQAHIYFDYTNSSAGSYWANSPTNTVPTTYAMELAAAVTANSPTNVSISNTKAVSSAKLLGTQGFEKNGGTAHTATITIPAGTTKAVIVFSTDSNPTPAISSVTLGGVNCDQLANYQKSFVSQSAYAIDNPTGTSLVVTTATATNVNILVQYWSGLKANALISPVNITPQEQFGAIYKTAIGTAKTPGSILLNYAFVNSNTATALGQVITEREVQLDNPIIPAGSLTGSAKFAYSIKSQYSQIGQPTIVNFQNKWQEAGNYLGITLELPTESFEIIQPGSVALPNAPINSNTSTATVAGVTSVNGLSGVITIDKTTVGLSNVDNTSDLAKPVSTAVQNALNTKIDTSRIGAISGVAGLGADGKVPTSQLPATSNAVTSVNTLTGVVVLTKTDIGLSNVDNTSDANKPVSTAQQTAISTSVSNIPDNIFSIIGNVDATKILKFDADTINTTGQTKIIGLNPGLNGGNGTLVLQETPNTFSNPQTINTISSTGTVSSQVLSATNTNITASAIEARASRINLVGTANSNDRANLIFGTKLTQTPANNNVIIGTQYNPTGLDFLSISSDAFRGLNGPIVTHYVKGNGDAKFQNLFLETQISSAASTTTSINKGNLTVYTGVAAGNHTVSMPNHTQVSTTGIITGTDFCGGSYLIHNRRYEANDIVTITASAGATFFDGVLFGLTTLVLQPGEIVRLEWNFPNSNWIVTNRYNSNVQEIVTTIDLTTTGLKTLYTSAAGRFTSIESLTLIPLTVTGTITTVPTVSVDSASVGDVYASRALTNFNAFARTYSFDSSGTKSILQPLIPLNLNVTTATAGATVHSVKAILKIRTVG
jgi:Cellulase (glycosyl hydrolase family 5)